MSARRPATILPAMTLAEAIETTRIHRIADLTGDRSVFITTRPCRAPHHTLSDAGLIGGGHVPMPGEVSLPTTACSSWMHGPSSTAMSSRSGASRKRSASYRDSLPHIIDLAALVVLSEGMACVQPARGSQAAPLGG
jgi:hypothetical protein